MDHRLVLQLEQIPGYKYARGPDDFVCISLHLPKRKYHALSPDEQDTLAIRVINLAYWHQQRQGKDREKMVAIQDRKRGHKS